jgi:hypothetical protein
MICQVLGWACSQCSTCMQGLLLENIHIPLVCDCMLLWVSSYAIINYRPNQENRSQSAWKKVGVWGLGNGGRIAKEASANREEIGNHICHIVSLSLVPELVTSFKYIMCRTNFFWVCSGIFWAANSIMHCHIDMTYGGLSRHLNCKCQQHSG